MNAGFHGDSYYFCTQNHNANATFFGVGQIRHAVDLESRIDKITQVSSNSNTSLIIKRWST